MKIRVRCRRGIKLVEIVITSAVMVLMVIALVTLSGNASTSWANSGSKMMADNDASLTLQALARDVRDGIRATVNADKTQLTVVMPYVNAQGDFDRYVDGQSVNYYLSNNRLYRRQGTSAAIELGRNITAVSFALNGTEVKMTVTARQQAGTKTGITTLTTNVTLRNELDSGS